MATLKGSGQADDSYAPRLKGAGNRGADRRRTAEIAHHLKNRLTAILGFCDLILDAGADVNAGDGGRDWRQDVAAIRDNAVKAGALVRQVLADKGGVEPATVDVAEVFRSMAPTLRRLAGPRVDVAVDWAALGDTAPVRIAPECLEQIVLNLVSNAADASPPGETVSVRAWRADGDEAPVLIEVADRGSGIPEASRDRIFEPFVSTKADGRGSGLGLSIVRDTVEAAGGSVQLDSTKGEGTTVTVRLALSDDRPDAAALGGCAKHSGAGATNSVASGRVLLVDDESPTRMVAARALLRAGFHVVEAVDGGDALDRLERDGEQRDDAFDVVVSDVAMPGLDGWALARRVRESAPELGIVLTSGYEPDPADAAAVGVRFLPKPFSLDALVKAVRQAISEGAVVRGCRGSDQPDPN